MAMRILIVTILCLFVIFPVGVEAAYVISGGKIVDIDETATLSLEEHFALGAEAYEKQEWEEAKRQFMVITRSFPSSPYAKDAYFYLGVAFYELGEFEFANREFSSYIKAHHHPCYFEQAVQYKFAIAECFRHGARRHMFGSKQFPKWLSAHKLALEIYDEVIATMPCHELAAQALYTKGWFLWSSFEYRSSVEAFQTLIKRFPKHELALESYANINKVYLDQCQREFQNPDLLALAQLNVKKFKRDFPGEEERTFEAEQDILRIKEVYAQGLFDTGQFYERLQKPEASCLYYQNAIQKFPDTEISQLCRDRLITLGKINNTSESSTERDSKI